MAEPSRARKTAGHRAAMPGFLGAAVFALGVLGGPAAWAQDGQQPPDQGQDGQGGEVPADAGPLPPVPQGGPAYEALGAPEEAGEGPGVSVEIFSGGGGLASELVHVPVISELYPGMVPVLPTIESPVADDPGAAQRGMRYFNRFNCIGCHAPNGGGGMGPSLSNHQFIYGRQPENIYLSILQGRPGGMPPWGGALPDQVIWDLVAYIRSISKDDTGGWGATVSADGFTSEQVPAEYMSTVTPWEYMQPFGYGQAPFEKPKGSPPLETPTESLPPE